MYGRKKKSGPVDIAIAKYRQYKNNELNELKINRNEIYYFYKLIFTCRHFVGFD